MLDDERAKHLYEEGRVSMAEGRLEAAVDAFEESVLLAPHFKTLELLGECLLRSGRTTEAVVPLAAATALNRQVRAPAMLAHALLLIGDRNSARRVAQDALEREPNNRIALQVFAETSDLDDV